MNAVLVYLDSGDRRLFYRLSCWTPPHWFRLWMLIATRLGDGWLWILVALALLVARDYAALVAAGLACGVANIAMILLKRRFKRCRPRRQDRTNHLAQLVRADLSAFDDFSFPSGHTLNAFAIGTVLSSLHPALFPAMVFAAMSVGASRVFLGMHFVTDVLAGAVLGVGIGRMICGVM
jgi:undecaprenyl-diphosphatase